MNILGISALYHDSAAALIRDGEIIAAAQEERFTRKKHDADIPVNAALYCLIEGEITAEALDYVVFYDDPLLTLDRYMKNILALGDESEDLIHSNFGNMFSKRLWVHELLKRALGLKEWGKTKFLVLKHHLSHAASAFFPSPFDAALIITADGVGEWTTLSIGIGHQSKIELKEEIRYPHSLGLLYSAFTFFCGFKVNSGDYKFMGLSPYGEPTYYDRIRQSIINIKDDGSFRLNTDYFDYQNGRMMVNEEKMSKLFGGGRRMPESRITKREMDIAASVQLIAEDIILKIARYARDKYAPDAANLVLAGGVALNCVANGKLLKSELFKNIWIQPAAGDAGGALGAALYVYYHVLGNRRESDYLHDKQKGSLLGPEFSMDEIKAFLEENRYPYHFEEDLPGVVARLLQDSKIIGLFQGKMEFGPRALGNRSIIADPRSTEMQAKLNLKIKFRESFRPFAPSVLKEKMTDYFDISADSPYMLFCAGVKESRRLPFNLKKRLVQSGMDMLPVVGAKRSDIPAVTHVDYSARIQSVDSETNRRYYDIIRAFERLTGCGVVVNTSFNVRGEPIVCTPEDAYRCFMRSDIDVLAMGDFVLHKSEQPEWKEGADWRNEYDLD